MREPVLGILTLYLNDSGQLEEKSVYRKMIAEGGKLGLDVFVFTPADVNDSRESIHALVCNPATGKWSREWRSFPHMIYDRCRIQRSQRFQQLLRFRSRYGHLTFLNRPLRNKWTVHQTFAQQSQFRHHLPDTVMYQASSDLLNMLKKHNVVYVKPINGTGGRGILRIEKLQTRGLFDIQGRQPSRRIIAPRRLTTAKLESVVRKWCRGGNYLVQQGIALRLPGGRVHDYRMLVQKNGQGKWQLTGIAARVGAARSVTSNLHGGGRAVKAEEMLKEWLGSGEKASKTLRSAEKLGLEAAAYLENSFGALCELALDLAIGRDGRIYILEVNPKPAREVFARTGERDVYRNALKRPLEYALWLYRSKQAGDSPSEAAD